jgi:hypothetical protein
MKATDRKGVTVMNKVIADLQKEFAKIQDTLKAQGDQIIKRVKEQATREKLMARGKEIEKLVEKELKRVEPAVNRFLNEVRKNAKKAGIDLNMIEKTLREKINHARKKPATRKKSPTRKKSAAAKSSKA